jgi:hypothetical protein
MQIVREEEEEEEEGAGPRVGASHEMHFCGSFFLIASPTRFFATLMIHMN